MNRSKMIYLCLSIFSMIGAYVPAIWGSGMFSFSSVIFSAIGGFFGIWIGYKLG